MPLAEKAWRTAPFERTAPEISYYSVVNACSLMLTWDVRRIVQRKTTTKNYTLAFGTLETINAVDDNSTMPTEIESR